MRLNREVRVVDRAHFVGIATSIGMRMKGQATARHTRLIERRRSVYSKQNERVWRRRVHAIRAESSPYRARTAWAASAVTDSDLGAERVAPSPQRRATSEGSISCSTAAACTAAPVATA